MSTLTDTIPDLLAATRKKRLAWRIGSEESDMRFIAPLGNGTFVGLKAVDQDRFMIALLSQAPSGRVTDKLEWDVVTWRRENIQSTRELWHLLENTGPTIDPREARQRAFASHVRELAGRHVHPFHIPAAMIGPVLLATGSALLTLVAILHVIARHHGT